MTTPTITLPGLHVVRSTLARVDLRAADDDAQAEREGLGLMDVRFSPFNTWYRIDSWWEGSFMERTVPGAFKRTFTAHRQAKNVDAHNIKTMFNHGQDLTIGQKLLGDIDEIAEDADTARSSVWLWDTSYNRDLLPGLRSGAYGSSFMFQVIREEWNEEPEKSDDNPDGIPERTIREARVFEAGPVTWPASPTATAGMRCWSDTETYYDQLERFDPSRVARMRSQITALRSAGPAQQGTPAGPGPATARPTDPARSHSAGLTPAQRRERLYPTLKG